MALLSTLQCSGGRRSEAENQQRGIWLYLIISFHPEQLVYPAVEISENGPHPAQWARLPKLGPM